MAGRPITILVTSDTSGVEDGSKRIADSLDNVQESLSDVESAAKDTGDALGTSLGDGAKDAARDAESALDNVGDSLENVANKADDAGDKLKDSLGESVSDGAKDVSKSLEKVEDSLEEVSDKGRELDRDLTQALKSAADGADDSGKRIGDGMKRGTKEAASGFDDLKREANSSAEEAASSFDGSAEGIIDTVREIAAEGGASFGALGGAIGLGLAAGLGIALAKMQELGEANTEAAQGVADLAAEFSELGGNMDAVDIGRRIQEWGREVNEDNWITFWVDEAETNFQKYADLAEEAGVNTKDAFRGMKGSAEDAEGFLKGTQDEWDRLNQVVKDGTEFQLDGSRVMSDAAKEASNQASALGELRDAAQTNIEAQSEAIDIYNIEKDAIAGTNAEIAAQIDLKNELADAAMSAAEADIALVEGTQSLTATLAENGHTIDINTESGRANRSAILDQVGTINDWAQAQIDAGGNVGATTQAMNVQKEALINQVAPYFGSRDAARQYIEQVLKTPKAITTDLQADSSQGQRVVNDFVNQRPVKIIDVRADTSSAEHAIANLNGRNVVVNANAIVRVGQPLAV